MPRSKMDEGDRSALMARLRSAAAALLMEHGRTTSSAVAALVELEAPELVARIALPLAHNQIVAMSRVVLKRSTRETGEGPGGARFPDFDRIAPEVGTLLPRTIAVPRELAEELLGNIEDDDGEEGEAATGRPPIEFVSLGRESMGELDAAIEYLQQQIRFDQRRLDALIAYRSWKRRKKGA
jgi:hypothetical protein